MKGIEHSVPELSGTNGTEETLEARNSLQWDGGRREGQQIISLIGSRTIRTQASGMAVSNYLD